MAAKPTKTELRTQFNRYNTQFFGGVLPAIPIHWARMKAYGDCWMPDEDRPLGLIRLSTMHAPRCGWRGILLHEMIHAHLDIQEVDEYESEGFEFHGPRFVEACNRIGAELGLEPIDEASAWSWPHYQWHDHHPEIA